MVDPDLQRQNLDSILDIVKGLQDQIRVSRKTNCNVPKWIYSRVTRVQPLVEIILTYQA